MATSKLARPTFLVENANSVEVRDGFIRIDLGGVELALTPFAANLIGHRLNIAIVDFYEQQRERNEVLIAKLPTAARVVHCVGEAC